MLDSTINNAVNAAAVQGNRDTLSNSFFRAAFADGNLRSHDHINPSEHVIFTKAGDTLLGVASAYRSAMNLESPANAAHALAVYNNILPASGRWQDVRLKINQEITIPIANGLEIAKVTIPQGVSTRDVATLLRENGRLPSTLEANPDRAHAVIEAINRNDSVMSITGIANLSFSNGPLTDVLAVVRDDFAHVQPLQTPGIVKGAETTLIVTEVENDHMINVLDFARSYSRALTPQDSALPTIMAYAEPAYGTNPSPTLRTAEGTTPGDPSYLILNHSYRRSFSAADKEIHDPRYRDLPAIHVVAAGNEAHIYDSDRMQNVAIPYQLGPRAYIVGAAHPVEGGVMLADYTSVGADIVAPPIALLNGENAYGTSFASPMMAALNQKMLELYGGTLTQEEIISAAYMSTSMALTENDPARASMLHGYNSTPRPVDVVFTTNAGGRPHDDRAGAGMIDPARWQENLNIMAGIKMRMEHVPDAVRQAHNVGVLTPVEGKDVLGQPTYTYTIPITQDMTLDRLALVLPHPDQLGGLRSNSFSGVSVTSPSGFTFNMPQTPHGTVGTSAFSLEDVKVGQSITIVSTGKPLAEMAQIVLNGQADGNVIQATRDTLMEMGRMPRPLTEYAGDRLKSEVDAEAAAARRALEANNPLINPLAPSLGNSLQDILSNPTPGVLPPVLPPNIKF